MSSLDLTASAYRLGYCVIGLLWLGILSAGVCADRIALVIGNESYTHGNPLKNPVQDATDVAALLKQCGFTLIDGKAQTDLDHEGMEAKVASFRREAQTAKVALFFFAGHGFEVGGSNYLVPVDAKVEEEYQVKHRTVALDEVLGAMVGPGTLKVVILDCCRDNPLGRGWGRSQASGLAVPRATPDGTILLYAAAPGRVAGDGRGDNSPFTAALKTELLKPGLEIEQVFKAVGSDVFRATGKQRPWLNSSFYGSFSFVPAGAGTPVVGSIPTMPVKPPTEPEQATVPANQSRGFSNSLGMKMVLVPGTKVLCCEHETRVQDFREFVEATGYRGGDDPVESVDEWLDYEYEGHKQGPDHPVVNVSWEDAKAFCAWLSKKEGKEYRLPTDHEWSVAVGIGDRESEKASPKDKSAKLEGVYPWGTTWPPPSGAGNFSGSESAFSFHLDDYRDNHAFTAPAGSYKKSQSELYDLSGNVWEWCEDWYSSERKSRVLRGGSWLDDSEVFLRSSDRCGDTPTNRYDFNGFRVVVAVGG